MSIKGRSHLYITSEQLKQKIMNSFVVNAYINKYIHKHTEARMSDCYLVVRCIVPLLCDIKDLLVRIVINEGTNVVLKLITLHVFYRMGDLGKGRFAIVEFLGEGAVEVVPTTWLYKTFQVNIEIIEMGASI